MPKDNAAAQPPAPEQFPWEKSYPVDIQWNAELRDGTMLDMFDEAVKKYGDRVCAKFLGAELTYKEIDKMVDHFAKGLQDQGIGKGSKVGLCLPNSPFYLVGFYAALKVGATVVNFNPRYPEKEMEQLVIDSEIDIMLTTNVMGNEKEGYLYPTVDRMLGKGSLKSIVVCDMADALPTVKAVGFRALNGLASATEHGPFGFLHEKAVHLRDKKKVLPVSNITYDAQHLSFKKMMKNNGKPQKVAVSPDDIAVLQYTGGTTGIPKAAMLSHNNLYHNMQQAKLWFTGSGREETHDRMLAVLPFFHVFGMTVQMNLSMYVGAEIVMVPKPPKAEDMAEFLKIIQDEKPTIMGGVPILYKGMIDCKTVKNYDLSSLNLCISGAAPLPKRTAEEFKALTGLDLVEGYGLSETSPCATANPLKGAKKTGSIGMPLPLTEVKIMNLEFPDQSQPINVSGEICLRGPQIMQGYWKRPDETVKVIDPQGWFHTGDVGYIDADGYVFINDRIKDMINVNGMKVFSLKVESALIKHEAVSEVCVIGVPSGDGNEKVKAFVVLKPGKTATAEELTAFARQHLVDYEVPKLLEFRDAIPKTSVMKPDKKALKAEEKAKAEAAKNKPAAGPKL